jgi:hypothetical protein
MRKQSRLPGRELRFERAHFIVREFVEVPGALSAGVRARQLLLKLLARLRVTSEQKGPKTGPPQNDSELVEPIRTEDKALVLARVR